MVDSCSLLEGDDAVLSNLDLAPKVLVPAVALGELFFGAAKSGRPSENTARVEREAPEKYQKAHKRLYDGSYSSFLIRS